MMAFSADRLKNNRLQVLDALRGFAILLVICRHWSLANFLTNAGWVGVDLFFVLSGFLVSQLLYAEHDKNQGIDYLRFFLRRGLKIYPLFFLLLLATAFMLYCTGAEVHLRPFLHEALFVQNYFGGVYLHTWSLALEEHFYIILLLLFAFFFKRNSAYLWICCVIISVCLFLRVYNCVYGACDNHFYTHTRVDSLFAGALVAYTWRYKREMFRFMNGTLRIAIFIGSIACFAIFGFIPAESSFTQTVGFTVLEIASVGLLLFALTQTSVSAITFPFAFAGYYSYSIYLFHIPAKYILEYFGLQETTGAANTIYFFIYTAFAISGGVLISELIEQPVLRLRNRWLPSRA